MAPEKHVPFLAFWVGRFLTFCARRDIQTEEYREVAVAEFLDMLCADDKIQDWQSGQADDDMYLLGHRNVETTMIYTHVLRNMANAPKSPLDVLYGPVQTP